MSNPRNSNLKAMIVMIQQKNYTKAKYFSDKFMPIKPPNANLRDLVKPEITDDMWTEYTSSLSQTPQQQQQIIITPPPPNTAVVTTTKKPYLFRHTLDLNSLLGFLNRSSTKVSKSAQTQAKMSKPKKWQAHSARPGASFKLNFDNEQTTKRHGTHPEAIAPLLRQYLQDRDIKNTLSKEAQNKNLSASDLSNALMVLADCSAKTQLYDERVQLQARIQLSRSLHKLFNKNNTASLGVLMKLILLLRPADCYGV